MDNFKIKGKNNPKIKSKLNDVSLKFRKTKDDLSDPDAFERFCKSCEKAVRNDPRYKNYINHLKTYGFNFDVFQSGLNNDDFEDLTIDMHHGPMFGMYDLCSIVIDHKLNSDESITEFDVALEILGEHEEHNIQLTMLSRTNHELTHDGKIFIHLNQTFGNILNFIKKYKKGIRREHLYTLEKYISLCNEYEATDNDYLELSKVVKKIKKYMQ